MSLILGLLFTFLGLSHGLYQSNGPVVDLTPSNFHSKVISSEEIWIVEFYAPWCGHCKSLVPEYQKAAKALKGVVKVGAVNADEHKQLGGQYQVQGFPTIKVFGADKQKPTAYNGERSASGIVDAALKAAREMAMAKLNGRGGGSGGSSGSSDVIELTDQNFGNKVLKSDDIWFVEFFAPWCGHCKNLAPHWEKAATELKGKVKLGALDATVHGSTAAQYEVKGYPTIKIFHKGQVEEFNGGRTSEAIVNAALEKLASNIPAPEIEQITSQEKFDAACKEHGICVIAVLPHILDCQSKCRNDHLKMLKDLGEQFKSRMWGWGWTEAMAQSDFENTVEIGGYGYPALTALSAKKLHFAPFKGSFSAEGIKEFLRDISYGRGGTTSIRQAKLPSIVKTDPWDGKDGTLPVEEDFDLDDLPKDEL